MVESQSKISIKILQVLHGDAFCIRFLGNDSRYHNIFIDGGFASTYNRTLKKEAERVASTDERIDIFVITHTDQDHISGALEFVRDYGEADLVDQYWFNHVGSEIALTDSNNKISIAEGIRLRDGLGQNGRLFDNEITNEVSDLDCYGAKLTILSPSKTDLENYKTLWSVSEQKQEREALIASVENDYEHSVESLMGNVFTEDSTPENRVSIAFLFQAHGKSGLFLADSCPSIIADTLKRKGYSSENKLRVNFVKLAHHASKFSTSDGLLSLLDCDTFIISANGKNRYSLPHKEPLARILSNSERNLSRRINFVFNYDNEVIRGIFSRAEIGHYNFSCLYPRQGENGYTICL